MIDVKDRWKSITDRERWTARGAALVAKTRATKEVWFPSGPVETGTKAASTAKRATKRTARKTTGTAKKSTSSGSKRANGTAKKSAAKKTTARKSASGSQS